MAVHGIADGRLTENDEARMTKDGGMIRQLRTFWGAHAPSRADFGALAEIPIPPTASARGKVRDHEDVIASTRGVYAPL
jgi:hypothetical protein